MPIYTKRPVDIEARLFDGSPASAESLFEWMREHDADASYTIDLAAGTATLSIITLEGEMTVSPGDQVIKGVQGEFYPCKPDIFDATYDRPLLTGPEYATVQELNIVAAKTFRWWETAAAAASGAVIGSVISWSLIFLP